MKKIDWSTFKSFIDVRNLSIQFLEHTSAYDLWATDGIVTYLCDIYKGSSDATDFESNYKSDGNVPIERRNIDGRAIKHETPRPLGTYTYFTGTDDDHTDPHAVGGDSNVTSLIWNHAIDGDNPEVVYMDFNTINNLSYVRQGDIMWEDAVNDQLSFNIVPKTTTYSGGSSTNYNLYGGYLIIPAAGDGTITVADNDRVLVQNTPNEFGDMPAGYFDADWNTSTKQFENITPNFSGTGEYNLFGAEVTLHVFMHRRNITGTGRKDCMTNDVAQLGHNMRVKILAKTVGDDHAWSGCGTMMMYRNKTT